MGNATVSSLPAFCRAAGSPVCFEIEDALHRFFHRNQHQPHGLILGLDKFRQLKAQQPEPANMGVAFAGVTLVIDGSEPNRISVF